MLCIPIVANSLENALRDMAEASEFADIIEFRIDYIKDLDLKRLLEGRKKPVIVTNRPVREGGRFEGSEEERLERLKLAIQLKADFVDIEHDSIQRIGQDTLRYAQANKTQIIASYHNFRETPGDLAEIYRTLAASGADIVKIVTYAKTITDNVRIYRMLQRSRMPTISFCMGEYGLMSRILYKRFSSYLTFAALQTGKESAPGQISVRELLNTYHVGRQDRRTAIYGLIGNPVSHSISPIIHNTLFKEMDLNSVYVPFKVDDVGDFLGEFRELDVKGYSVTIPHKEAVLDYLDEIDPLAKKIGAVNTIVNRDGRLAGYNTDCEAAIQVLEDALSPIAAAAEKDSCLKEKKVTLLGAGGVARAIAFGLKAKGAQVTVTNRHAGRAQSLASEVGCNFGDYEGREALDADVVINATPVGMYPHVNETPIGVGRLKPGMAVFDTIYNPLETRLLRDAKALGCKVAGGLPMFVRQAAAQFKLWTGKTPPMELIEEIAYAKLAGKQ